MGTEIIQKRGKGKRGQHSKAESAYISRCIAFGCLLTWIKTGIEGTPAEWNHARSGGAGMLSKHSEGYALSPEYHRLGNESLSAMGIKAWQEHHGITEADLVALSKRKFNWKELTK